MITLEQAKALKYGQTIFSTRSFNNKAQPHKVRVTGKVQTWKRSPERVRVPWKHGLYTYGALTEHDLNDFALTEVDALNSRG